MIQYDTLRCYNGYYKVKDVYDVVIDNPEQAMIMESL
jgi:hypothetical protein